MGNMALILSHSAGTTREGGKAAKIYCIVNVISSLVPRPWQRPGGMLMRHVGLEVRLSLWGLCYLMDTHIYIYTCSRKCVHYSCFYTLLSGIGLATASHSLVETYG